MIAGVSSERLSLDNQEKGRDRNMAASLARTSSERSSANSKKLQEGVAKRRLNINADGSTELTLISMAKEVEHYITQRT